MDLTLHIGPHKTGTTAIQMAFADHAGALRKRGLLYPKCNWIYPAQHRLAFALKGHFNPIHQDRPNLGQELGALSHAIAKSGLSRVFLSSEEFFAAPADALARLKTHLAPHSVRIFAFPRRPDDFLLSCYNQKAKQAGNGFAHPLDHFLERPGTIAPEIHYNRCLAPWIEVFGKDAITLTPFEAGPPLTRLCQHFQIDLPNRPQNVSVPGAVCEIMRLAKEQQMDPALQKRLFKQALKRFSNAPPLTLSSAARRKVVTAFEAENTQLFEQLGLPNPFKSDALIDQPDIEAGKVSVEDLNQLITQLV